MHQTLLSVGLVLSLSVYIVNASLPYSIPDLSDRHFFKRHAHETPSPSPEYPQYPPIPSHTTGVAEGTVSVLPVPCTTSKIHNTHIPKPKPSRIKPSHTPVEPSGPIHHPPMNHTSFHHPYPHHNPTAPIHSTFLTKPSPQHGYPAVPLPNTPVPLPSGHIPVPSKNCSETPGGPQGPATHTVPPENTLMPEQPTPVYGQPTPIHDKPTPIQEKPSPVHEPPAAGYPAASESLVARCGNSRYCYHTL